MKAWNQQERRTKKDLRKLTRIATTKFWTPFDGSCGSYSFPSDPSQAQIHHNPRCMPRPVVFFFQASRMLEITYVRGFARKISWSCFAGSFERSDGSGWFEKRWAGTTLRSSFFPRKPVKGPNKKDLETSYFAKKIQRHKTKENKNKTRNKQKQKIKTLKKKISKYSKQKEKTSPKKKKHTKQPTKKQQ